MSVLKELFAKATADTNGGSTKTTTQIRPVAVIPKSAISTNLLKPSISNTGIYAKPVIAPPPPVMMVPAVSVFKPVPTAMPIPTIGNGTLLITGQSAMDKALNVVAGLQPNGQPKEVITVPDTTIAVPKVTAGSQTISKLNPLLIGGILLAMIVGYFLFIKK